MAQIANVEILQSTPAQRTTVRNAVTNLVRPMEKTQNILKDKLKVPVIFVIPPGFCQWPAALQRFIYILTEVCQCREVDFVICAPNMRVSGRDLRPSCSTWDILLRYPKSYNR